MYRNNHSYRCVLDGRLFESVESNKEAVKLPEARGRLISATLPRIGLRLGQQVWGRVPLPCNGKIVEGCTDFIIPLIRLCRLIAVTLVKRTRALRLVLNR
jgi:hypothetical protein